MSFLDNYTEYSKETLKQVRGLIAYPFEYDGGLSSSIIIGVQCLVLFVYIVSYTKSAWYFREELRFRNKTHGYKLDGNQYADARND